MRAIYFDRDIPKTLAVKALKPLAEGVVFSRLSPARMARLEEPELPGPRWVALRNRAAGICATDLAFLFADIDPRIAPAALPGLDRFYLGHEVVSTVTEVGPDVTRFQPGDRAIMHTRFQGANCLSQEIELLCPSCAAGNLVLCENASLELAPRGVGGGWADGYTAHETELYPVPEELSDDEAMMIEPLAVGVHTVLRRPPQGGERVLVLGCGMVGLNVVQALRALVPDCHITALARYDHQAEAAARLGADEVLREKQPVADMARITGGKAYAGMLGSRLMLGGFAVVYDAVASAQTLQDSLRWARARGAVVMAGAPFSPQHLDLTPVWYQEVDLIGVKAHGRERWQGQEMDSFALAAELLQEGRLTIDGLITHRFALEQWREAIDAARDKKSGSIRVVFDFPGKERAPGT